VRVVEVGTHHRAKHAAPAVLGATPTTVVPAQQQAARHRHLEREAARAADNLAVLPRGVHALEREHARETLGDRGRRRARSTGGSPSSRA
jgi:hypothetical protein